MIVVATTEDGLAAVASRLAGLGAGPCEVRDPGGARRLVLAPAADESDAWRIASALRAEGLAAVSRPDEGPGRDAWFRSTEPIVFGSGLSVGHVCSEHERAGRTGMVELGPGGFGSGRHPATGLVIQELGSRIAGGERVLDVGCGSGVLGLCALRLGASQLVAVDIDAAAVEATARNAALNEMHDRVCATSAPLGEVDGDFDVVLANVGRAAVVELAPELGARVAEGGWLAVSGFSPRQCSLVAGFLRPLREIGRRTSGEWSLLVLSRLTLG